MTRKDYEAAWRAANPEKTRAAAARYRTAHPERTKAANKRWRAANRERFNATRRRHRAAQTKEEKLAAFRATRAKEYSTREGHARRMIRVARNSGKPFSLQAGDILTVWPQDDRCPVFGCAFSYGVSARQDVMAPSLDRIDSRKGYVPGNIAVISWEANQMKRAYSKEAISLLARWLESV